MDKLTFILNELSKISSSDKKIRDENIVVICPYHKDTTPSFSINICETKRKVPLGFGRCWSCGEKGSWNSFANKLNLKNFGIGELSDEYMRKLDDNDKKDLLGKSLSLTQSDINEEFKCFLSYPISMDKIWRGFSGKFLSKFKIYCSVDDFGKDCILVPVYYDGVIVGALKGFDKKPKDKKFPSYLNYSGKWIREYGLFPYDYINERVERKNLNYVIICEGLRDALSLIELGYPALCIFGTNTWTDKKLDKIKLLGVDTLVIMMDAGKSGIKSTNDILEATKNKGLKRITVKMQKYQEWYEKKKGHELGYEIDPNSCPKDLMRKILKWVSKQV